MRILLTGRDGQVGWELERALAGHDVTATDRKGLDLSDPAAIERTVAATRPEVIVNAAAYTAVDKAESEPEAALAVNGVAPGVLAEQARRCGALLVHYSTDYIFDGSKRAPYTEQDAPHPLNVYGSTKLEGERRIAASGARHLVLRTSWVYAPRGRNFFLAIAQRARAGGPLRVVSDQLGVPTSARFVAECTRALIERGAEGLFNAVPSGATSWHGFAVAIVEALGLAVEVQAIGTAEYPTAAKRPAYSVLDNAKLVRELPADPGPWQAGLRHCIEAWTPS